MSRLAVLILLVAIVQAPIAAADQPAAANPSVGQVVKTKSQRGNVRYGPNREAAVAATLPAGTEVDVLGKVQAFNAVKGRSETWYQIRFPRQGKAWMHQRNLEDSGDTKTFNVKDRANVRDDATKGANIVADLDRGDTVEFLGQRVGEWMAVYPPKAVAYIHEDVLGLKPTEAEAVTIAQNRSTMLAEHLWPVANRTYGEWAATKDFKQALTLDWPGLGRQMEMVAKDHPDANVRGIAAQRRAGIDKVIAVQIKDGARVAVAVPQPEPLPEQAVVRNPQPAPQPDKPKPPVATADQPKQPDVAAPKQPETAVKPPDAKTPDATSDEMKKLLPAQTAPATAFVAQGFLEQGDNPAGTGYALRDTSSSFVAWVAVANGAHIQLSEYIWRQVGVAGDTTGTAKDDLGRDVPIIAASDVKLLGK